MLAACGAQRSAPLRAALETSAIVRSVGRPAARRPARSAVAPDRRLRVRSTRSSSLGLGSPVVVSPPGISVSTAAVAIGARRAVVVWAGARSGQDVIQARLGDTPATLGRTRDVALGRIASAGGPFAAVTPDGSTTACWVADTQAQVGPLDCVVAAPHQHFGPVQQLTPVAGALTGVLADRLGRVIVVWPAGPIAGPGGDLSWSLLSSTGRFSAPLMLGANAESEGAAIAVDDAGAVGVAWITPDTGTAQEVVATALAPGAAAFSSPVAVIGASDNPNIPTVAGGDGLAILSASESRTFYPVIARLGPHGRWNAPVVPAAPPGTKGSEDVLVLPRDGSAMLLSATVTDDASDCSSVVKGRIAAALLPPGSHRLSSPVALSDEHQIAEGPQAVPLADGGVLAVWSNDAGANGETQLEYSLRSPGGTFDESTPLPGLSQGAADLAAGGNTAALAWIRTRGAAAPQQLVISTLRTRPPFVKPAPRPLHPSSPCS
jgi:hypothetical protein